jgi:S-layer protein
MTSANAATASSTAALGTAFTTTVTGFEKLVVTGGGTNTVNVARLGFTDIQTAGDTALTLDGVTTGSTLRLTATGTAQTVNSTAALLAGTNDSLNLVLTGVLTADVAFSTTGLTATDIETINITSSYNSSMTAAEIAAAPGGGFENGMIILGNQAKTIVVGGAAGLNLVAASTALTSLDASSNTVGSLGNFSWTSGATTGAVTVKGLALGINTIVLSAATVAGTYTGSANGDTVTIQNALANVLNLGDGTNLVNGVASGNNVITGGAGADTFITATSGNNVINFGNGANAFTATSGNNTYTGGTGVDTVIVGSGNNTISTGAGADSITVGGGLNVVDVGAADGAVDTVIITAIPANGNIYTTITGMAAGDRIDLSALTTVPRVDGVLGAAITLAGTAAFADFLSAATSTIIADADASLVKWFQYNGDTYIVVDNTFAANTPDDTNTFENGIDSVIKLTGLINLATSTTAIDVLTIVG